MATDTVTDLHPSLAGIAPDGRQYGWKLVRPDFTTRDGFRWPFPQGDEATRTVRSDDDLDPRNDGNPCPSRPGDGLSVGRNARGCAAAGFSSPTVLIVSFDPADLLGADDDKWRVRAARVEAVLDQWARLRDYGRGADLGGADLGYADLGGADLGYADLGYADLRYANLGYADLGYADLGGADLGYANLGYADLGYANLRYADLGYANLGGADLGYANLGYADLGYANPNEGTIWPAGFDHTTRIAP